MEIIQSLWIGEKLSELEKICINSFIKNSHEFHLYVYDEVKDVPEDTVLKDASKILSRDKIFKYKNYDTYSGFSNLFRYALLLENGGYWVDLDVICLKPFDFKMDYIFAGEKTSKEDRFIVNNCIIKVPENSPIINFCFQEASKKDTESLKWGQTGPLLLTKAILKYNLEDYVLHPLIFCPIDWWNWRYTLYEPHDEVFFRESFAIHFWNEMLRRNKINKSKKFPENCTYEKFKKDYL